MKGKKLNIIKGALFITIIWYFIHLLISSNIIPDPFTVFLNFFEILIPVLLPHLAMSLYRILTAVVLALIIGVSLGLLIGRNERVDQYISPIIYLLYPIPKIAFLPIIMLLLGLGNRSKIVLIIIIVVFQIIVTTRDSVKNVDPEYFYSAQSIGISSLQTYQHIIIPAILPQILTALRITVGTSIAVLFYAENFATQYGIGYYIMNSWIMVNYVDMFSGILAVSFLGLLIFKSIDIIEIRFCLWINVKNTKGVNNQ
ncbi:MAG: ABC transporter permease [Halanaerobiales bacterium]|nr:ABC transporter permease [Halanaerobiales bacterium]